MVAISGNVGDLICFAGAYFTSHEPDITMRLRWQIFAAAMILTATPSFADDSRPRTQHENSAPDGTNARARLAEDATDELKPQEPDTDLFALMAGRCSTLRVAGRDFACRTVAYAHSNGGRAYFTIALDDPADHNHIISFSGANGKRTNENAVRTAGRPDALEFQAPAEGRWPASAVRRTVGWNVQAARKLRGVAGFQHCLFLH